MARLKAGVQATPHNIRLKGYREELEKRGGRRLNVDIESPANEALQMIMRQMQEVLPPGQEAKIKDAISAALVGHAEALRKP